MSIKGKTESDLNALNERLDINFALKSAGLGVWEIDLNTDLITWDNRCRDLFGGLVDHVIPYQQVLERIHPEDVESVKDAVRMAVNPGSEGFFNITFRISASDTPLRWVRFSGRNYYNEANEVHKFAGVAQDVSKEIEDRIRIGQSEQRFRGLIENAPFATAVYNSRDLIVEIANEAMIRVWGKTPAVIGMKLAEALPELEGQPFIDLLEQVYDTGIAYKSAEQQVDLVVDGRLQKFWFTFSYEPLKNADGKVYAILNMAVDVTERVANKHRIEKSRKQLLALFEQSPVAIATISEKDLTFLTANAFYAELAGRTPEQLIGKKLLHAMPELEGQGFDQILRNVISTGKAYTAPETAVNLVRNGVNETIYVDITYQPYFESDGYISGVLIVATHVTQQVLARKMVEASEARLRSLIDSAPAAMGLFVGRDLVIDLHNQAFVTIVGKGPDIGGRPLREVMPELQGQPFLQILDDVFTSGKMFQSYGSQVDIMHQGTMTHFYYNITYTPLFDENEKVYAILEIAIDVTGEILAKQKIAEAEQRLRGAIELAEMATWSLDIRENKFTYSDRFIQWLGLSETTKTTDEGYDMVPEEFKQSIIETIGEAIKPGSSGLYQNEHPVINRLTGQQRIIHTQAQVFYDSDGNPEILSGTALDVTEQRKVQLALEQQVQYRTEELEASNEELAAMNEELAATNEEFTATNEDLAEANQLLTRSNQNLEQFAYIASHDLQEPLRKIKQFGDLLKMQYDNPSDKALTYLERMQSAATRMSVLIEDLLTFARISAKPEDNEIVYLHEVVNAALADLDLRIQETGAVVNVLPLPMVSGSKVQLGQLFLNLLSNALKFHQPGNRPQIQITSHLLPVGDLPDTVKPNRWAIAYNRIDVADNGIGFDEKYAHRIFQVFQRLHGKSEFSGTGIGLAICEKVAMNHGGAITAKSEAGQGAVFSVFLPATYEYAEKLYS
jgi:PAS domain S-box-containing protein